MKRALFLALALFGLAVQAQDAEAIRWGGPEASEPVASIGTWVPLQAARIAATGQFVGTSNLVGNASINGTFTISGTANCLFFAGGRICSNGAGELDVYGASTAQVLIVAGTTYLNNNTSVRGTMTWTNGFLGAGSDAIAFGTNGQRLHLGTGGSDYLISDGTNIVTPGGLLVSGYVQFDGSMQVAGNLSMVGIVGTAGSGTGITLNASGQVKTIIHKITVAENALTNASTTQDITIWTVPAKSRVLRIVADATAAFTGGGLTAMTVGCGPSAGSTTYLAAGSIFTVNTLGDVAAEIGSGLLSATVADIPSMSTTTAISCRFTSTTANVVAATAGSVTFYIEAVSYP